MQTFIFPSVRLKVTFCYRKGDSYLSGSTVAAYTELAGLKTINYARERERWREEGKKRVWITKPYNYVAAQELARPQYSGYSSSSGGFPHCIFLMLDRELLGHDNIPHARGHQVG